MEEEINAPRENINRELFGFDTFELFKFVYHLAKNRNSLFWLSSELTDFHLTLFKVVYGDSDPNWLLSEMVDASIIKEKSVASKGAHEGKNLIDNAMQKMKKGWKNSTMLCWSLKVWTSQ